MKQKNKESIKSNAVRPAGRFRSVLRVLITAALLIGILGAILLYLVNARVTASGKSRILAPDEIGAEPYDCILVLGCQVRPDGQPSLMLRDRVEQGLALYRAGAAPILFFTGDSLQAETYDEVGTMKRMALAAGVPESAVAVDPYGLSTYDSVLRAGNVFGYRRILIVTQRYHLYRALYIAEKMGLDAYGVDAEVEVYPGQTARDLREIAARAKDWLYCRLRPAPEMGYALPDSDGP